MVASEIRYLAQAYFHQDFDLDADTPIGIVRNFRTSERPATVAALRRAIQSVLEEVTGETHLTALWLNEAGSDYDPRDDGISTSEWFRQMLEELDRE